MIIIILVIVRIIFVALVSSVFAETNKMLVAALKMNAARLAAQKAA
jgi:hypothetical protein